MFKKIVIAMLSAGILGLAQTTNAQPMVRGSQLMSPQERAEHRARMQTMTPAERQEYVRQHHEEMRKLAEQRGLTIPEEPGPWPGMGPGYGQSYGPGYGRGWCGRGPGYGYGCGPRWRPDW